MAYVDVSGSGRSPIRRGFRRATACLLIAVLLASVAFAGVGAATPDEKFTGNGCGDSDDLDATPDCEETNVGQGQSSSNGQYMTPPPYPGPGSMGANWAGGAPMSEEKFKEPYSNSNVPT